MVSNEDTLTTYLRDIASYPRISIAREQELSLQIQNKDIQERAREEAIRELVESNLRLVFHCLKEFDRHLNQTTARLSNLDLLSEGNIGLLKAARSYKPDFGEGQKPTRFSTYACKCIKSHMIRAIKKARFIHIPEHHFTYWTEIEAMRKAANKDLSDEEICKELNVSKEAYALFMQSAESGTFHLEDFGKQNEESLHWSDYMADEQSLTPYDHLDQEDLREYLFTAIDALPPRTGKMISMLYFNENAPTLKDLSKLFGISSERCRQICVQGIKALRKNLMAERPAIAESLSIPTSIAAA